MAKELELFETDFQTARPANPLYCHTDFLEKLAEYRQQALGKRATLLLQRLAVDERRLHYKATHGVNRGWRRSRLGGSGGSHFYAWWAPGSAAPFRDDAGFGHAPERSFFLRDIRHHDNHAALAVQSFADDYLPLAVPDIRREQYGPPPWTPQQARFASARHPVRILKGHPGSGKTTALLHAADAANAARVLYLTYSRDLAGLAQEYFERYCSAAKRFQVATYATFLRQLTGVTLAETPETELRRRFQRDAGAYGRSLGVWSDQAAALFDELHAHLVGDALPVAVGRFAVCGQPRVPDKAFRERRTRFLGGNGAAQALEAAARLEKTDPAPLAERYFPELALAWKAAVALERGGAGLTEEFFAFDCIAVDECQDLTPLESFVIAELAVQIRKRRGVPVPVLLAGDEAQTVRPSDFEWGWLNDLFHDRVGTPSEHKLSANLRSPRRIAGLVNRVWDLYGHLDKRDRPSGVGQAEIEDDSTDQVFYCTAAPGVELDALVTELASREGLALIALGETPAALPEAARSAVLSPAEAKGLDFHSVCVIGAGRMLETIVAPSSDRFRETVDIDALRKRLAIDQLRVALSRPTERLFWLDISPAERTVRASLSFLNADGEAGGLSPTSPAAVLKTLSEEELDLEERIQRCQADARQYLAVRPDLAWSRAQQAVALLGDPNSQAAVTDPAARQTAWMTLAEVCFSLAMRESRLSPELGRPDLFDEARRAAEGAGRKGLAVLIPLIARVQRGASFDRLSDLGELAYTMPKQQGQIEPWLRQEIAPRVLGWVEELERAATFADNAPILVGVLPRFYQVLELPDAGARTAKLQKRTVDLLMKARNYRRALDVLEALPERQQRSEAVCLEGLGEFARAAEAYRAEGDLEAALQCYRSVPDFAAALALVRELGGKHAAAPSLEWIAKLQEVIAQRPDNFAKTMKPAEKKLLEGLLEQALGAKRKKATAPKAAATRKPTVRGRRPKV